MQGATTKLGYIYPLVIPNGERPHGFGIPASAIDLRQGLRLMSLIFKTQSGRGCVNVTRGSLSKAYAHTQPDIIRCLGPEGMEGRRRIVVPSTPIHDPITKRVSRYNRSRDPYLTLPYFGWSDDGPLLRELGRHLVDKRVERFVVATFHPNMIATRCHFRGKEKILDRGSSRGE